jgi:hypothetical protein
VGVVDRTDVIGVFAGETKKALLSPIHNRKHLIFRNKSLDKPLRFLIAFKIKKGIPFKIDL